MWACSICVQFSVKINKQVHLTSFRDIFVDVNWLHFVQDEGDDEEEEEEEEKGRPDDEL